MASREQDEKRIQEIDAELADISSLFAEYRSWYDAKTQKVWFPDGGSIYFRWHRTLYCPKQPHGGTAKC